MSDLPSVSGPIRVGEPLVSVHDDEITYRVPVHGARTGGDELWFRVRGLGGDVSRVPALGDAALLGLLMPAMRSGQDIHLAGPVTAELLHAVGRPAQQVLLAFTNGLSSIAVGADRQRAAGPPSPGVVTGFSAGVDSFMTLKDYWLDHDVPNRYRLTHLLFSNVGAYSRRPPTITPRLGLPLIEVDSNLDDFYGSLGFLASHTLRNAAVALLLQGVAGRFLYSSSDSYAISASSTVPRIGRAEPVLLPLLSPPSVAMVPVGGEYSRVEKTLVIASVPESWESLDVCVMPREDNCSECYKCLRTQLTLEIAGVLDRYEHVFDLRRYAEVRDRYLVEVMASRDRLTAEIRELARDTGFMFSSGVRLRARALTAYRTGRRAGGRTRAALLADATARRLAREPRMERART